MDCCHGGKSGSAPFQVNSGWLAGQPMIHPCLESSLPEKPDAMGNFPCTSIIKTLADNSFKWSEKTLAPNGRFCD